MVGHTGFWNAALAACADRRRAVAIDLRGHGNSRAPADGDYSIDGCAGDVLAVLDALELDVVVLVGHSFGACVTTEVAARRPDRVRRLVLVDPPGDFTRLSPEVREEQLVPYIAALSGDGWRSAVEADFDDALAGSAMGTAASVRARLATMPRDAILGMFVSMMDYPAVASLERFLASPGAAVHAILAPANAWPFSLHMLLPAITTAVVPDVGHWIMLDAPARFVAALDDAVAGT
jgi:pimeloyl-ACP methyl ester carboxylesterase